MVVIFVSRTTDSAFWEVFLPQNGNQALNVIEYNNDKYIINDKETSQNMILQDVRNMNLLDVYLWYLPPIKTSPASKVIILGRYLQFSSIAFMHSAFVWYLLHIIFKQITTINICKERNESYYLPTCFYADIWNTFL